MWRRTHLRRVAIGLVMLLVLLPTLPVAAQTRTHIVQRGETLSGIAVRYNVTLQSLMSQNSIVDANRIYAGQVLTIPATGGPVVQPVVTYTVRPGDQLRFIAPRFGTTWQAIAAVNNLTNANIIYTGQVLVIPSAVTGGPVVVQPTPTPNRYIVQPGDTLFKIARLLGKDVYNIARANGILNLNRIFSGQVLVIP